MKEIRNIAFFGDGNCLEGSNLYQEAGLAGHLVASRGIDTVTGGYVGITYVCSKGTISFGILRIHIQR